MTIHSRSRCKPMIDDLMLPVFTYSQAVPGYRRVTVHITVMLLSLLSTAQIVHHHTAIAVAVPIRCRSLLHAGTERHESCRQHT
jgi:hypothetical protein